ncbi:phage holin family protein [Roseateles sp.]|uniref:phage holin family protein n=1 Tax=Roseateles sp. TaxID=1971397 RepID=UPI0032645AAF
MAETATAPVPETPAPPGTSGPGASAPPDSLLQQLKGLARELPGLVSDRVELLALELQRATQALFHIVALVVAIAILGVTVWLALWAALISLLMQAGLPLLAALLLTIGINGLVIAVAVARMHKLMPRLALSATQRHLTVPPDPRHSHETHADERSPVPAAGQHVSH